MLKKKLSKCVCSRSVLLSQFKRLSVSIPFLSLKCSCDYLPQTHMDKWRQSGSAWLCRCRVDLRPYLTTSLVTVVTCRSQWQMRLCPPPKDCQIVLLSPNASSMTAFSMPPWPVPTHLLIGQICICMCVTAVFVWIPLLVFAYFCLLQLIRASWDYSCK